MSLYPTEIWLGKQKSSVMTHPNAPIVINHRVNGRLNKNPRRMHYASVNGADWMLNALTKLHGPRFTYYIANTSAIAQVGNH